MNLQSIFPMVFAVTSIRFVRDPFQRPSTGDMPGRWWLPSTLRSSTALFALAAMVSSWRLVTNHNVLKRVNCIHHTITCKVGAN
jgi:hypothetical protein